MSERTALDPVNIRAGLDMAWRIGFKSPNEQMVTEYALMRHARGEEAGAEKTWLSHHDNDLTSWRMVLAHAIANGGKPMSARTGPTTSPVPMGGLTDG